MATFSTIQTTFQRQDLKIIWQTDTRMSQESERNRDIDGRCDATAWGSAEVLAGRVAHSQRRVTSRGGRGRMGKEKIGAARAKFALSFRTATAMQRLRRTTKGGRRRHTPPRSMLWEEPPRYAKLESVDTTTRLSSYQLVLPARETCASQVAQLFGNMISRRGLLLDVYGLERCTYPPPSTQPKCNEKQSEMGIKSARWSEPRLLQGGNSTKASSCSGD